MRSIPEEYQSTGFWQVARSRPVIKRAFRVSAVVGIVLAAINHGDKIIHGNLDAGSFLKILLTFCVPYSVSTYSSVLAVREFMSKD